MIVKIMGSDDMPDSNPAKPCKIVAYVNEVNYHSLGTGEKCLTVYYQQPLRELMQEDFVLNGNAYLMSDDGKTIQSFAAN